MTRPTVIHFVWMFICLWGMGIVPVSLAALLGLMRLGRVVEYLAVPFFLIMIFGGVAGLYFVGYYAVHTADAFASWIAPIPTDDATRL